MTIEKIQDAAPARTGHRRKKRPSNRRLLRKSVVISIWTLLAAVGFYLVLRAVLSFTAVD